VKKDQKSTQTKELVEINLEKVSRLPQQVMGRPEK